ncbi:formylmethanofuran dehydrogenase subunit C [Methanohalophilus mahii]|uniref:Formylmethanofuran dehydrogenase subunit C n=1 Tax=Methanohalophilus mahii (strain ATCC 35705 / DSM 5219 / SLP) TaxID=547558 RepID=D5E828_METMS|nr:formylmethanofuran dehydrogenase subunit C [Methanohalophilus mahii]ADE37316.1 Formylmethanofuran dehydrogenase subunit C [Methanohalophilus mahii DSM 5219]
MITIELSNPPDNLCDYTYNFCWNSDFNPDSTVPHQQGTEYTYRDIVGHLKKEDTVQIIGNVGKRLAQGMGASISHLGGSGKTENAGNIMIDGNVAAEAGMGMIAGALYIKGNIEKPLGNIVEVESDRKGYRKFVSITELVCRGLQEKLLQNKLEGNDLLLNDSILRNTLAARCDCEASITVEGDAGNGSGLLMEKGMLLIKGNSGMNTAAHLNGGTIIVKGKCEEFAGAYMKKGTLLAEDPGGHVGADMKGGIIYSKVKANIDPPAKKGKIGREDIRTIRKLTDAKRFDVLRYNKYEAGEEGKYITIKLRDGSLVRRPAD